jgi:hypothetical protein
MNRRRLLQLAGIGALGVDLPIRGISTTGRK